MKDIDPEIAEVVNKHWEELVDFTPVTTAEGAKTCWNCGAKLHYLPNGVTTYRCVCGAIDPEERQQQPTDKGAENILRKTLKLNNVYLSTIKNQAIVKAMQEFAALHAQKIADNDSSDNWSFCYWLLCGLCSMCSNTNKQR